MDEARMPREDILCRANAAFDRIRANPADPNARIIFADRDSFHSGGKISGSITIPG